LDIFFLIHGYKKGRQQIFFASSLLLIWDLGSGIRDKHPGSATLHTKQSNQKNLIMELQHDFPKAV